MYELPPILSGSAESQLRALRDYLVRLSQTLPTETTQPAAAQTASKSSTFAGRHSAGKTTHHQLCPSPVPIVTRSVR